MKNDSTSRQVIQALTAAGLMDPARTDEAVPVVRRALGGDAGAAAPLRRRMAEIAGYVGGAFVVGAAALFFGQTWDDLGLPQQVGLLLGIAAVLVVAGVVLVVVAGGPGVVRRPEEAVRRRLASVLVTGAALSAAFGLGLLFDDVVAGNSELVVFLAGGSALLISVAGYLLAPTALGQLAGLTAAAVAVPSGLGALPVESTSNVVLGLALLTLGAGWLALAEAGVWRELLPARLGGCTVAVLGAQMPVFDDVSWAGYLATAAVGVAAFGAYVVLRAWPYLATGVVAFTLAVPEALNDWTEGSLGAAGLLLATGVTLIVASLLGLRLRHDATGQPPKVAL